MIRQQIQSDMTIALKARDQKRLGALRYLLSQIKNREIDVKHELTDEEATKLLQTEARRRKESIEAYQKGGRKDLEEKERYELLVIEEFLPKQLTDEEIKQIIEEVKRTLPSEALLGLRSHSGEGGAKEGFGAFMKTIMTKVAGRADGKHISELLKASP